jgi:hypothetical protein
MESYFDDQENMGRLSKARDHNDFNNKLHINLQDTKGAQKQRKDG